VIKTLIFDFDGFIMDTESPEVDGWKAFHTEYGQEFPLQVRVRNVVGSSIANFDPAAHLAAITGLNVGCPPCMPAHVPIASRNRIRLYDLNELRLIVGVKKTYEYQG
jgi:beta-phosphoglucomutase-like phosphatase (HAD superfamily)